MISPSNTTADIAKALGIDTLPKEEYDRLVSEVAASILEGAFLKLAQEISDEEAESLNQFIETHESFEEVVTHIQNKYPQFEAIIQKETLDFSESLKNATRT